MLINFGKILTKTLVFCIVLMLRVLITYLPNNGTHNRIFNVGYMCKTKTRAPK